MIAADLVPFLESGVTVLIGTRDGSLVPDCGRGLGARVDASREQVTVFVSDPLAGRTLENIRDNARIAVCFTRPEDHYSIQLKGRVLQARAATPDEDVVIERYRTDLARTLAFIGLPTRFTMRLAI